MKIGVLENYLKMEVSKNWNFEELFGNGIFKIRFENWNFEKIFENGVLKIKFRNWGFGKLNFDIKI